MRLIVLAVLVSLAAARPDEKDATTLHDNREIQPDAFGYKYQFDTSNGISHDENGALKKVDAENEAVAVEGQYQFNSPDGGKYSLSYVANEFGFQPKGEHLPTPPPVPELILKSLKYIEANPPPVERVRP